MPKIRDITVSRTYQVRCLTTSYEGARVEADRVLTQAFADGTSEVHLVEENLGEV